jgi:hypothetical protein
MFGKANKQAAVTSTQQAAQKELRGEAREFARSRIDNGGSRIAVDFIFDPQTHEESLAACYSFNSRLALPSSISSFSESGNPRPRSFHGFPVA